MAVFTHRSSQPCFHMEYLYIKECSRTESSLEKSTTASLLDSSDPSPSVCTPPTPRLGDGEVCVCVCRWGMVFQVFSRWAGVYGTSTVSHKEKSDLVKGGRRGGQARNPALSVHTSPLPVSPPGAGRGWGAESTGPRAAARRGSRPGGRAGGAGRGPTAQGRAW